MFKNWLGVVRGPAVGFPSLLMSMLMPLPMVLAVNLLGGTAWAHSVERSEPAQYEFPVTDFSPRTSVDEAQTRALLSIFQQEFAADFGPTEWQFDFDWPKPFLGAGSFYSDHRFHVMLWGGLVRAPYLTQGALASVLCHELGHALGGPPFQQFPGTVGPPTSAEGQADHFAATVCLPRIYNILKNNILKNNILKNELLKNESGNLQPTISEPAAIKFCQKRRLEPQNQCEWVMTSGIDMIQFLQVYYDREVPFADPWLRALEQPSKTLHTAYPSYQCRMDTFVNGALCTHGLLCPRSRCWYVED